MARTRKPDSKLTFGGLQLDPYLETMLQKWLKDNCISLVQLKRKLIREHLEKVETQRKANTKLARS